MGRGVRGGRLLCRAPSWESHSRTPQGKLSANQRRRASVDDDSQARQADQGYHSQEPLQQMSELRARCKMSPPKLSLRLARRGHPDHLVPSTVNCIGKPLAVVAVLVGAGACTWCLLDRSPVAARRPTVAPAGAPATPSSLATSLIRCDLQVIREQLETIPTGEPKPDAWVDVNGGADGGFNRGAFGYRFGWSRTPFGVALDGDKIRIHSVATFDVDVRGRPGTPPINPLLEGSTDDNREAELVSMLRPQIDGDWNVVPDTLIESVTVRVTTPVEIRIPVGPVYLSVGVTDLAQQRLGHLLGDRIQGMRAQPAQHLAIRKYVEDFWRRSHEPVRLNGEPELWLQLTPQGLGASPVRASADGTALELDIGMRAIANVRQQRGTSPTIADLPRNDTTFTAGNFDLIFPVDVTLNSLQQLLDNSRPGLTGIQVAGHTVDVEQLTLTGHGDRLLLEADVDGDVRAKIYLTAKPRIDANGRLELADLDVDVASNNLLLEIAAWWKKEELLQALRDRIRLGATDLLERANQQAKRFAEVPLGDGATLRVQFREPGIQVAGIDAYGDGSSSSATSLRLLFHIAGQATVTLTAGR